MKATAYQNMLEVKAVPRGKWISINACIRKKCLKSKIQIFTIKL